MAENDTTEFDRDQVDAQAQGAPPQETAVDLQAQEAEAAKAAAQQAQQDAELRAREETRLEAERLQRESEQLQTKEAPADTIGDGSVELRYLGTSDEAVVGQDDEGRVVTAQAGGPSVFVTRDIADYLIALPHDTFEEVE